MFSAGFHDMELTNQMLPGQEATGWQESVV